MQQLTREEFAELVVLELQSQGLKEVPRRVAQAPTFASLSLLASSSSNKPWTAQRTYNELLMDQPRAPQSGMDALADALVLEPDWLHITPQFVLSVVSVVSVSQQAGAANLAAALFVGYVSRNLEGARYVARECPPGLLLPSTHIPALLQLVPRLMMATAGTGGVWRTYLEVLRECIQACAGNAQPGELEQWTCALVQHCLPPKEEDTLLQAEFIDCFAGLCKHCGSGGNHRDALSPAFALMWPTLKRHILAAAASSRATCLSLLQLFEQYDDDDEEVVVPFVCRAWGSSSTKEEEGLVLENFLLAACSAHSSWSTVHVRALCLDRALASQSYTPVLWRVLLALNAEEEEEARRLLTSVELGGGVRRSAANALFAYLAKRPVLLTRLKLWQPHVAAVIATLQQLEPVPPPPPPPPTTTATADVSAEQEAYNAARLNYKRVLSALRGKSLD